MKNRSPILFTAAGSHTPLLDAFARAFGQRASIYAADLRADAPALKAAGRSFLLPSYTDPSYPERLLDLIHQHRPWMLFPLHDYELIRLATLGKSIEDLGTRLMLPPLERLGWCHDKHRMSCAWPWDQLPSLRPIPGWVDPHQALDAVALGPWNFPLILKPRLGSASLFMRRVDSPRELLAVHQWMCERLPDEFLRLWYPGISAVGDFAHTVAGQNDWSNRAGYDPDVVGSAPNTDTFSDVRVGSAASSSPDAASGAGPFVLSRSESVLIQPFFEHASEFGFDILGDLEGNVLDVWVKQKLEMRNGRTQRAVPVCRPLDTEVGFQLGRWMRQPGNLDVDVLSDARGVLWLADVNPRFGGGYRFSDRFGARFPELLIQ